MNKNNNKKKIIYCSWVKLFWKYWVKRVSIDMIVEDAWIAKGTFYLHFKNKAILYENIVDDVLKKIESCMSNVFEDFPDPKHRMISDMIWWLNFFSHNDIMRNLLYSNKDYFLWKIDYDYIMKFHERMTEAFTSDMDWVKDVKLISEIMWFYMSLLEIKDKFEKEEDFMSFALKFASIIVNWLFSDYESNIKDFSLRETSDYVDGLEII